jgi:hypothetical protein
MPDRVKIICVFSAEHLRESLEELMEEYEVDLAVSGHVHAYARTCNVYNQECIGNDDGGTTHVTLGTPPPPNIQWIRESLPSVCSQIGLTRLDREFILIYFFFIFFTSFA